MGTSSSFKEELILRLRNLIDLKGHSLAAIEKKLGRKRGYVGDALREEKRLSLNIVLEVLEALNIDPKAFFAGKVEEEKRLEEMSREYGKGGWKAKRLSATGKSELDPKELAAEIAEGASQGDPIARLETNLAAIENPTQRQVATLICSLVRLLERRGDVDHNELVDMLRELSEQASAKGQE